MKKMFYSIVMMTMVCGFMACENSKNPASEQSEAETVEMEEANDTATIDTSNVVTRGGKGSEGFGRCLQSGCYCKGFEGRGQTCRNCGHAFRRHY